MAMFDVLAVLMVLAATFGWVNDRYLRLPITVGVMAMGLTLSLALVALSLVYPPIKVDAERLLAAIDFDQLLLHGALGFLLFAGALHIEFGDLREQQGSIGVLAVVGTLLSTLIVGGLCWLLTRSLGLGLTPLHCLVFGALISPTDPIALLHPGPGSVDEAPGEALHLGVPGEGIGTMLWPVRCPWPPLTVRLRSDASWRRGQGEWATMVAEGLASSEMKRHRRHAPGATGRRRAFAVLSRAMDALRARVVLPPTGVGVAARHRTIRAAPTASGLPTWPGIWGEL